MCTILIVDDSPEWRHILKGILAKTSCDILTAADGKEALRLCLSRTVDVVITDLFMPDMDGLELASRKEDICTRGLIAVSGGSSAIAADYLPAAKSFGADYIFHKPIDVASLLDAVRALLEAAPRASRLQPAPAEL